MSNSNEKKVSTDNNETHNQVHDQCWIIGNWKLNPVDIKSVTTYVADLDKILKENESNSVHSTKGCQLVLAPSLVHLYPLKLAFESEQLPKPIGIAAQDVSSLSGDVGAYTGDVSAQQLQDMGVQWVIVGHSERREHYQEDHQRLRQKVTNLANCGIGVIYCVGETLQQRRNNSTKQIITEQLTQVLQGLSIDTDKLIIAYEPIWAIGTGESAQPNDVEVMHQYIHQVLVDLAANYAYIPIIYGGSVNPTNAPEYAQCKSIAGVLVGGASLDAKKFLDIAQCFAVE